MERERQVFRSWINPHSQRRNIFLIAGLVVISLTAHIAAGLAGFPRGPWPPPWYFYVFAVLAIPAWVWVMRMQEPRALVRIDDNVIKFAYFSRRRSPQRLRVRLLWRDVDRVHLGCGFVVLHSGQRSIALAQRLFPPEQWENLYAHIQLQLEPAFDLITPSPAQIRFEKLRSRRKLTRVGDIAAACVVGLMIVCGYVGLLYLAHAPWLPPWAGPAMIVAAFIALMAIIAIVRKHRRRRDQVNWRERRVRERSAALA